ncbi:MAG: hypothetical protein QXH58_03525 [Nitrososphaerales archaeon]
MGATYDDYKSLSEKDKDLERARQSLIEEFEAINWYQQRISSCNDPYLRKILEHNRDEEKEHAAMLMEWIRKNDPQQDKVFGKHD